MDRKSGTVKQIISPNCILLAGPISAETGVPMTKYITLQGIQPPEFSIQDKENPRQESFGYQAREFLRKQVLGQQVEFTIEHKIKDSNDKVIGRIFKNGQDMSELQLKEGLAQVRAIGKPLKEYEEAQSVGKSHKKGIWSGSEDLMKFNKIDLKELKPQKYNKCLVEDVAGLFVFYVYIPELSGMIKCSFGDIFMPQVSSNLQVKAKWALQELILQQEVAIKTLGFDEKFQSVRVDIFKNGLDIKKELLSLGFYKLAPNAFQLITDQKRYNELREAQSQAEIKLIGIWKDALRPNTNQGQVQQGNKSIFLGKVIEVHSGDALSVLNNDTRETIRVLLASIKAPKYGKVTEAFGFESKDFVRRHAIGRSVRVEVEYEKKIQPKIHEGSDDEDNKKRPTELNMVFVNIIILEDNTEQNLAVMVVAAGLATTQPPRGDDGFSRHLEELTGAQEQASKAKKGIHGKPQPQIKVTDLSQNPNLQRSKDAFDSMKHSRKLTAIVELVLNGSRLKLRFHEFPFSAIVLLAGVRCLPNEQNLPAFQKFSNIAMQYVKEHLLQRDVEVELESIDKKGVFHGHLLHGKTRENVALELLRLGLAVTFNPVQNAHSFQAVFNDAEKQAKLKGEGLWGIKNLDLSIVKGNEEQQQGTQSYRLLNGELKKWVLVEIADCNTLYFQDPSDKLLAQIEKSLSSFSPNEQNKLVPPFKKGLLCVAKFSVDGKWYRARILRELKNKYEVLFLDYGNREIVGLNEIRKMPDNLSALSYQAIRCNLAYLRGPSFTHEMSEKVGQFIRTQIFEKEVVVQLEYTDEQSKGIIVYLTKDNAIDKSLNQLLIAQGFAKLDKEGPELNPKCKEWTKIEFDLEGQAKGIWAFDDEDEEY